jgi:hypothetical protein
MAIVLAVVAVVGVLISAWQAWQRVSGEVALSALNSLSSVSQRRSVRSPTPQRAAANPTEAFKTTAIDHSAPLRSPQEVQFVLGHPFRRRQRLSQGERRSYSGERHRTDFVLVFWLRRFVMLLFVLGIFALGSAYAPQAVTDRSP